MRGDRGEAGGAERRLQQPDIRGVDVALARVGDLGRLEVGALDEAQVRGEREQRREIVLGPEEVRLQDGADVLVPALAQAAVDAERGVDVARLLHVDADEVPPGRGVLDELGDVASRERPRCVSLSATLVRKPSVWMRSSSSR